MHSVAISDGIRDRIFVVELVFFKKKLVHDGHFVACLSLVLPFLNKIFVYVIVPNYKYNPFLARKYIEYNPLDANASLEVLSTNVNQL